MEAIEQRRPIIGDARKALLRSPWRSAIVSLGSWAIAAVLFPIHGALRLGARPSEAAALSVTILIGGLATMGIVYLLHERVMRPAFAIAFRHDPPQDVRGVAVRPRLFLAWVVGAGLPLLAIAILLGDPDNARVSYGSVQRAAYALIAVAIVGGALITRRVARSVADPLSSVRRAMARVEQGDLDVSVEVDDATEVGILQGGFNAMVAGLRERVRLRDLFGRHVEEQVAKQALDRGVELGGELRDASAVFIDLIGSTALAATHSPTEIVGMLNDLFRVVVRVTEEQGGLVNKFEGDAALCVFGVPVSNGNHAASALRAARGLHEAIDLLRRRYPELDAGIGASTGVVLAGNVGAERRYEYTVIGDPVNEAARLTDEAKLRDVRVLASEAAVKAAGEAAGRWEEVDIILLRGRPQPTRVYEPR